MLRWNLHLRRLVGKNILLYPAKIRIIRAVVFAQLQRVGRHARLVGNALQNTCRLIHIGKQVIAVSGTKGVAVQCNINRLGLSNNPLQNLIFLGYKAIKSV